MVFHFLHHVLFQVCLLSLSLLVIKSNSIEDFEVIDDKKTPSRAESRELVEDKIKTAGVEISPQGRSQPPAGVYVIGKFRTGPQGRPPPKNRRPNPNQNQNQTRRAKPRPNRFQVIQIQSNKKQTNIRLQNGANGGNRRRGNKNRPNNPNNPNNKKGGGTTSTPGIAAAETISTSTISGRTTILMPVLAFDPNFQDI